MWRAKVGEGAPDTRRRVSLRELIPQNETAASVRSVLKTLVDARLVTTDRDEAEVAHEALIRGWPALQEWLTQDREGLRVHRRLIEAAREWEGHNGDESYLYRGSQLAEATELLKARVTDLGLLEMKFLEKSTAWNDNSRRANSRLASVLETFGLGALKDRLEDSSAEYQRLFSEFMRLTEQLATLRRELDTKSMELDQLAPVVFISYAKEDVDLADSLYIALKGKGFRPWMDKRSLLPGEKWQNRIPQAVKESDFLIACLSRRSVTKRGYVQTEFKLAMDAAMLSPEGSIYLIPVRVDDCEIPTSLSQYQYVDFKEPDAVDRIVKAMMIEWNRKRT